MEQTISISLERSEVEALVKCLRRRDQTICDIKQELCSSGSAETFEQEQLAFFATEEQIVERILGRLSESLAQPRGG